MAVQQSFLNTVQEEEVVEEDMMILKTIEEETEVIVEEEWEGVSKTEVAEVEIGVTTILTEVEETETSGEEERPPTLDHTIETEEDLAQEVQAIHAVTDTEDTKEARTGEMVDSITVEVTMAKEIDTKATAMEQQTTTIRSTKRAIIEEETILAQVHREETTKRQREETIARSKGESENKEFWLMSNKRFKQTTLFMPFFY